MARPPNLESKIAMVGIDASAPGARPEADDDR